MGRCLGGMLQYCVQIYLIAYIFQLFTLMGVGWHFEIWMGQLSFGDKHSLQVRANVCLHCPTLNTVSYSSITIVIMRMLLIRQLDLPASW